MSASINVGATLKPFRIAAVSAENMKSWARFLHDPNPIHLDPQAVKAQGLGERVINQGPANLAYIINMLLASLPTAMIAVLDVRYADNVYAGDAVEASGAVTHVVVADGYRKVTCAVSLHADGRGPVITGTAVLHIPDSN